MAVLTLSYRPLTFRDVVGQRHIVPILRAMVRKADMVPALILSGVRGTGKTTIARILAAALNCENQREDGDACGECPQCLAVQSTESDAVLEVDAASNGGVAEVERIRNLCLYAHTGRWRVIILDEAHSMSRDAFNALLKMLEEPPPNTVFVLLTTEADKILETVRSRAMSFEFRRIPDEQITDRLFYIASREGIPHDDDLLRMIASDAHGGLRDAVMVLDQCFRADVKDTQGYVELMGRVDISMPLLDSLTLGDPARAYALVQDYFVQSGDMPRLMDTVTARVVECAVCMAGVSGMEVAPLAQRMTGDGLAKALTVVWEVRERASRDMGDPVRLAELMVALLAQALGVRVEAAKVETKPILREEPLTVEEALAELARAGVLATEESADVIQR
jgi:DNA polymerase III subunit gamma/tau